MNYRKVIPDPVNGNILLEPTRRGVMVSQYRADKQKIANVLIPWDEVDDFLETVTAAGKSLGKLKRL